MLGSSVRTHFVQDERLGFMPLARFSFATMLKRLLPLLLLFAPAAAQATRFQVKLPPQHAGAVSGRLIVFAQPFDGKVPPASVDASPFDPGPVIVAAQEVASLAPDQTIELDADVQSSPRRFETAPPGRYAVQVVLDRNHDYARTGRGAGDLVSAVTILDLPAGGALSLDTELPANRSMDAPGERASPGRCRYTGCAPFGSHLRSAEQGAFPLLGSVCRDEGLCRPSAWL